MSLSQQRRRHVRRTDLVGVGGLIMLLGGAALFAFGADYPSWPVWLFAPLAWWSGSGLLIAWAILRFLTSIVSSDSDDSKFKHWLREKVIGIAGTVFAEVGFDEATLREIAERAGIHVNAVSEHFGDKLGLYTEVLKSSIMAQQQPVQNAGSENPADPQSALGVFICQWFERAREGGRPDWFARIMAREMARPTPALDRVAEEMGANYLRFRTLVGQVIGQDPNDQRTRMCVHSVVGQVLHYMQSRAMLARLWPELDLNNAQQRRAIADHIVTFSLAGMENIAVEGLRGGQQ
jgi:TetR/AcrR family transcriptional regulator, regulator of cefoperazone and chloramphenicol sensitivity